MIESGATKQQSLEQLNQAIQQLSASQRAELINRVLRETGLTVALGGENQDHELAG